MMVHLTLRRGNPLRVRFARYLTVNKIYLTSTGQSVVSCIQTLLASEPFAVLCTQGDGQPYGSVVAFAYDDLMTTFIFATPIETRKYRLLRECDRVALVVTVGIKYQEIS
ncbi:MAG: pyridoxamine 5'-phosphate oxidase family protein [Anaerolineales bacterium]|nr:MAG: pyridoxamine 5'-phosphate oxidase family protein [Anaerolineales bacterium]